MSGLLLGLALTNVPVWAQTLEGLAVFPADTFAPGPTSGQFIMPANGRTPPFVDRQPVQGVSSVLRESNGDFLIMSDNGFGAKGNSADYVLRVYRISPDFKTKNNGSGSVAVRSFIGLRDPDFKLSLPIVAASISRSRWLGRSREMQRVRSRCIAGRRSLRASGPRESEENPFREPRHEGQRA